MIVDKSVSKLRIKNTNADAPFGGILVVLLALATIGIAYVIYQDAIFINGLLNATGAQNWLVGLAVVASFVNTGIALIPAILFMIFAIKLEREHRLKDRIFIYTKHVFMIAIILHSILSLYLVFIH